MPLALFVHGFDGDHDQWRAFGKVVQQAGYRVVFLDPPGHGASKAGQCDPIVFSEAVGAAFKILGPISLYLGHSMGAAAGVMATSETMGADAYVLIASPVVMARSFSQLMAWATTGFYRTKKSCVRLPDFLKAYERSPLFT